MIRIESRSHSNLIADNVLVYAASALVEVGDGADGGTTRVLRNVVIQSATNNTDGIEVQTRKIDPFMNMILTNWARLRFVYFRH